jgi:hypothetical protein
VLLSIELRHLGGAVRRGNPDGGAVAGFTADVALFAVGMTPTPETAAAVRAAITAVRDRMAPWSAGRCYLNFAEEAQNRRHAVRCAYPCAVTTDQGRVRPHRPDPVQPPDHSGPAMSTHRTAPTAERTWGRDAGRVLGKLAVAVATLLASTVVGALVAATNPPTC